MSEETKYTWEPLTDETRDGILLAFVENSSKVISPIVDKCPNLTDALKDVSDDTIKDSIDKLWR